MCRIRIHNPDSPSNPACARKTIRITSSPVLGVSSSIAETWRGTFPPAHLREVRIPVRILKSKGGETT
jgi:hypothetical protein